MARSSKVAEAKIAGHSPARINIDIEIERRRTENLTEREDNPRTHSGEQVDRIGASIVAFGWTNPILVDGDDVIIAGHARWRAARKLGMEEVPVIVLRHLTPAQRRALVIADNQLAIAGAGWDEETLRIELAILHEEDYNLDLLGFDDVELARLLDAQDTAEGLTDDDAVPELPVAPTTIPGDIWKLDDHLVLCGDATVAADVERLMGAAKADLVIIDAPYNVDYAGKTKAALKIKNDNLADAAFYKFLLVSYQNLAAVTKEGAGIYVFHADTEGMNFRRAMVEAGWKLAQCCVWVKQTLVMGRQDYHWQHEPILYGWKPGASHRWFTDRKQTTVWNFDRPTRSTDHPTMKPVSLISYPILNSSRNGDVVLDTFGGAGSTLIACAKHGRVARLVELDPRYVDVTIRRWQDFSGKKAILAGEGRKFDEVAEERRKVAA